MRTGWRLDTGAIDVLADARDRRVFKKGLEMKRMSAEVLDDSALLVDVISLLETKTPLAAWPAKAVTALAEAVAPETSDPRERSKAARLERHLFVGPPPNALTETTRTPSRRSDRLRADLADLTPYGAGLHLVMETL